MYKITCFADEISANIQEQAQLLGQCGIKFMELRSVDDINVLDLTDQKLKEIKTVLDASGIGISCIGSPLGKVYLEDAFEQQLDATKRALEIAHAMQTDKIRVFSFYSKTGSILDRGEEVRERLGKMVTLAEDAGIMLVHENEINIFGQKSENCRWLAQTINSSSFRLVFDPSNYASAHEQPTESLAKVKDYVVYGHIKDIDVKTDLNVLAGTGDAMIEEIVRQLPYQNDMFLSLEPHLAHGGQFRGFTGPENFVKDHRALLAILDRYALKYA